MTVRPELMQKPSQLLEATLGAALGTRPKMSMVAWILRRSSLRRLSWQAKIQNRLSAQKGKPKSPRLAPWLWPDLEGENGNKMRSRALSRRLFSLLLGEPGVRSFGVPVSRIIVDLTQKEAALHLSLSCRATEEALVLRFASRS